MKRAIGGVAAVTLLAAGIMPMAAQARGHGGYDGGGYHGGGYYGGGWGGHGDRHRDHDGLSAGEVFGIAALIGAVAIVASSASKDREARGDTRRDQRDRTDSPSRDDWRDAGSGSEQAVNACAEAARDEAAAGRGYAEILDVDPAYDTGDGWRVEGRVERRESWSARNGDTSRFSCTVRNGQVADLKLSNDTV